MTSRLPSGFDEVAVWLTIWEQREHVVSCIFHTDRTVAFQDRQGQWHEGDIARARVHLRPLARAETPRRSSVAGKSHGLCNEITDIRT